MGRKVLMRRLSEQDARRLSDDDLYRKKQPFLNLRTDSNGGSLAYKVKFLQEPKAVTDRQGRKHLYARVDLIEKAGQCEPSRYTLDIVRVMLRTNLLPFSPLTDKTFKITSLGKVYDKKTYEFDVTQVA